MTTTIVAQSEIDPSRFGVGADLISTADEVHVVDDADMPTGHNWMRIDKDNGPSYALLRASVVAGGAR